MTEEFICRVAKTLKEATELIEAGFEYVTDMESCKLFRKRKTSLVGSSASLVDAPSDDIPRKPLFSVFYAFYVVRVVSPVQKGGSLHG